MLEIELVDKASQLQATDIRTRSTQVDGLLDAARQGHVSRCVEMLCDSRLECDINAKDSRGRTALHHAAQQGCHGLAFAILAHPSFSSSWAEADMTGTTWTAVEVATAHGHHELAASMQRFIDSCVQGGSHKRRKTITFTGAK